MMHTMYELKGKTILLLAEMLFFRSIFNDSKTEESSASSAKLEQFNSIEVTY